MKLAEALIERASLRRRLDALKTRILANARTPEGLTPAEEPLALLEESDRVANEFLSYVLRINATNSATELAPGMTVADAISARDVLRLRQQVYGDLAAQATGNQESYYPRSEAIRYLRNVDVGVLQKKADDLARQARELDTKIQAANWAIDLSG